MWGPTCPAGLMWGLVDPAGFMWGHTGRGNHMGPHGPRGIHAGPHGPRGIHVGPYGRCGKKNIKRKNSNFFLGRKKIFLLRKKKISFLRNRLWPRQRRLWCWQTAPGWRRTCPLGPVAWLPGWTRRPAAWLAAAQLRPVAFHYPVSAVSPALQAARRLKSLLESSKNPPK